MTAFPLPPREFATRVGCVDTPDLMEQYVSFGAAMRQALLGLLPEGWSFEGRRVLDFGCGSGRALRHFALAEAQVAEFIGCDIDADLVAWVNENLSPPIAGAHVNEPRPPLTLEDDSVDLAYALSVFTHITAYWSDWLLEIHRVLKPDGVFIATFCGAGMSEALAGEDWDPDRIGMNSLGFARGRPFVLHSEWWLRAHWGRLFEFAELRPAGFGGAHPEDAHGHGVVVLRPKAVSLTAADLERDQPGEERYLTARKHHLVQLEREGTQILADYQAAIAGLTAAATPVAPPR